MRDWRPGEYNDHSEAMMDLEQSYNKFKRERDRLLHGLERLKSMPLQDGDLDQINKIEVLLGMLDDKVNKLIDRRR